MKRIVLLFAVAVLSIIVLLLVYRSRCQGRWRDAETTLLRMRADYDKIAAECAFGSASMVQPEIRRQQAEIDILLKQFSDGKSAFLPGEPPAIKLENPQTHIGAMLKALADQ